MTAVPTKAKMRRPGGRTASITKQIHEAVLALLAESGLQACSFPAVAARANVDPSTLYKRWPNRAFLVLEAVTTRVEAIVPLPDTGRLADDFGITLMGLSAFLGSALGRASLGAALEIQGDPAARVAQATRWQARQTLVETMFLRAIERGEVDGACDWRAAMLGAIGAIYQHSIVAAEPHDPAHVQRIVAAMMRAIAPEASVAGSP